MKNGGNVNHQDHYGGDSPFMLAVNSRIPMDVLQAFVRDDLDLSLKSNIGYTAYDIADMVGNHNAKVLIDAFHQRKVLKQHISNNSLTNEYIAL